ncbi:hypothetical protein PO883_30700 [Massilia sp. DJPM01]|uniref:hypothetical protein n=1 Tax=Massilia sp. DJPM01 TaxID=3024404 RepID=UPI00259D5F11|nr:hypothetical protein [Massilia sp. DJPM01]MDM5181550.1 hypothetical protein [Massilia sp. DJPM01]
MTNMDPYKILEEARPMLDAVLTQAGLVAPGEPLDLDALRAPFSQWLQAQTVGREDLGFFVGLVGAFISQYLLDTADASVQVDGERISVRVPFPGGTERQFDPYAAASSLILKKASVADFLARVCA